MRVRARVFPLLLVSAIGLIPRPSMGQSDAQLLRAERIYDGDRWLASQSVVLVERGMVTAVGVEGDIEVPVAAQVIELGTLSLLPGLIEAHSHILLHPYDETNWNDQVLKQSEAYRAARATVHLRESLMAGFTTLRDLGTEGAGYADSGLKHAVESGIIPGPHLLIASKAIVSTGSYGPKGFADHVEVPLGAEPADGADLPRVVRDQIGHGADWIKVYADYRWGPNGEAMPTFSQDELTTIVETAASSGRPTVAHAATTEGMRRAILAGVKTIEHGDGGTEEIFRLMADKGVAFCPTLAAGDAISQYGGWKKGRDPEPDRIRAKKRSFALALKAGVTICNGSDVGVFPHGDNVRELELLVDYGMSAEQALQSATSVNADALGLTDRLGRIRKGLRADLIAVEGDPSESITALRSVRFVMKAGKVFKKP